MMIVDVIRKASTEHEIYFLLTSYVEAVRFGDKAKCLSEHQIRLPFHGINDVRERFGALRAELNFASKRLDAKACMHIKEALEIFSTAFDRLAMLDELGYRPVGFPNKGNRSRLH